MYLPVCHKAGEAFPSEQLKHYASPQSHLKRQGLPLGHGSHRPLLNLDFVEFLVFLRALGAAVLHLGLRGVHQTIKPEVLEPRPVPRQLFAAGPLKAHWAAVRYNPLNPQDLSPHARVQAFLLY